jgi:hypothetical protein
MKFSEFTESNNHTLNEQPALAYANPMEFQSRYGMSPAQAEVVIDNVVKLNPGYSSPAVKDSIRNYLLNNPETLQSANDNIKPATPKSNFKINPKFLVKGAVGKALGLIGMIFDPSLFGEKGLGDGTITPEIQLQWDIEKNLRDTDPAAYIEYLDTQWGKLSDEQKQDTANYPDPKTTDNYKDALKRIEPGNTDAVRPEGPAAGMPATRPVRKPDTPPSRTPADPRRTRPAPTPKPAEPGVEPDTKPPAPTPKPTPKPTPNIGPETGPFRLPDLDPSTLPRAAPQPKPNGSKNDGKENNPKKPRKWKFPGLPTPPGLARITPKLVNLNDPLNLKRNA